MGYVAVATVVFQVLSNTIAGYLMDNPFIADSIGTITFYNQSCDSIGIKGVIAPGIAYGVLWIIVGSYSSLTFN